MRISLRSQIASAHEMRKRFIQAALDSSEISTDSFIDSIK